MWRAIAGVGAIEDASGTTRRAAVARAIAADVATRPTVRLAVGSVLTGDPAIIVAGRAAVAIEPPTTDVARPGATNLIARTARVAATETAAAGSVARIARHERENA